MIHLAAMVISKSYLLAKFDWYITMLLITVSVIILIYCLNKKVDSLHEFLINCWNCVVWYSYLNLSTRNIDCFNEEHSVLVHYVALIGNHGIVQITHTLRYQCYFFRDENFQSLFFFQNVLFMFSTSFFSTLRVFLCWLFSSLLFAVPLKNWSQRKTLQVREKPGKMKTWK